MASTKEGNDGTEVASNYEMMASRRASPNSGGHSVEQGERGRTGDGNAPERQQCRATTIPVSRVLSAGLGYDNCGNCNTRHHSQMPPPQWKRENCRTQWQTATNSSDTVGRQLNSRESRCFTSTRKNNPKRKKIFDMDSPLETKDGEQRISLEGQLWKNAQTWSTFGKSRRLGCKGAW